MPKNTENPPEAQAPSPQVGPVRVLLHNLTDRGQMYAAGQVVADPSPRLLDLARGEKLLGKVVAEFAS